MAATNAANCSVRSLHTAPSNSDGGNRRIAMGGVAFTEWPHPSRKHAYKVNDPFKGLHENCKTAPYPAHDILGPARQLLYGDLHEAPPIQGKASLKLLQRMPIQLGGSAGPSC